MLDVHPQTSVYQRETGVTGTPISEDAVGLFERLRDLDLLKYAAELEIKGYTVIPPEVTQMRSGWVEEAREAIFQIAERRQGIRLRRNSESLEDVKIGALEGQGLGFTMSHILVESPAFDEALLNPVALTLSEVLVGRKAVISSTVGGLKGPGGEELKLHCDALAVPSPFPAITPGINMTWALTPYTIDDGCLCVVPGSHRLYRHPLDGEGLSQRVPVEAAEGSLIMWGEYLWHGAFVRRNSGIRVNLILTVQRPFMRSKETWDDVPEERFRTNGPRFSELLNVPFGWRTEGPPANPMSYHVENAYD